MDNYTTNNILFDIYEWSNAWEYYFKGYLIMKNGIVLFYNMDKLDGFNPSLKEKLSKSNIIKNLTIESIQRLNLLFNSLNESCNKNEIIGVDKPHLNYYGYKEDGSKIHIYSIGEESCVYTSFNNKDIMKELVTLLDLCISYNENLKCAYCSKLDANLYDSDLMVVFCSEKCRIDYLKRKNEEEEVVATIGPKDVPVMMMHRQNGRY